MSEEEKKAIEQFKNFIFTYQDVIEDEYSDYEEKECAKEYQEVSEKIINLIEKQSKEIEELKEKNYYLPAWVGKKYVSKDKIKAKIEENKWAIEHYDCDEADYKQSQAVGAWNVLQRLLKESEIWNEKKND